MAGDPLRDAFRSRLATHRTTGSVTWAIKDTLNTATRPDASVGYLELEFPGGDEEQYTAGSPGSNLFREIGLVTLRVVAPLAKLRDTAETYARTLRNLFRNDRFAVGSGTVRILAVAPMGGGHDEAGLWVETIQLRYQTFNTG